MIRPIRVRALPGYRIYVEYSDGSDGIVDLSADVGIGVFTPLLDEAFFSHVYIGQYGQIAWTDDIEICPDAAYQEMTGRVTIGASVA